MYMFIFGYIPDLTTVTSKMEIECIIYQYFQGGGGHAGPCPHSQSILSFMLAPDQKIAFGKTGTSPALSRCRA